MIHSKVFEGRTVRLLLASRVFAIAALSALWVRPAAARDVEIGGFSGSLDTTLSIGASLRVEDRDCKLIYTGHGGCNDDPIAINSDDGDLNYDRWDFYSAAVKATVELELSRENLGAFLRGTAFYDAIANEHDPERTDLDRDARYRSSPINSGVVGLGFLLLDAYLFGSFDVEEHDLDVRLGNQVVSWGESLFTPGGIAQTNGFDVTRLRVPGSQLKEAFVPAPMLWASMDLFGGVGIEGYYQFYWNRTEIDPTGSFFSFSDLVGRAAQGLFLPGLTGLPPALDPTLPADPGATGMDPKDIFAVSGGIPRFKDDEPHSQGQGGVALRYFAEPIRTEFGLYYIRYHGKAPGLGFQVSSFAFPTGFLEGYFKQYAEDIDLYGFSLSTELFNVAIGAEVSYRPNDPVPIESNGIGALAALDNPGVQSRTSAFKREKRIQAQVNAIWSIGPGTRLLGPLIDLSGADDISAIGEVALVKYDLDHQEEFDRVNAELEARLPSFFQRGIRSNYVAPGTSSGVGRTRANEFSWGYQILIQPTYTNPFGVPIRVQPRIGFQHDVNGNTPGTLPFIDGRKAFTVGVNVDYLNTWALDLSHTRFFGASWANLLGDRDFVSASLSYSF